MERPDTVVIEGVNPWLDGGRHPVKRIDGGDLTVSADIFKDGHDEVDAVLKWRRLGEDAWHELRMQPDMNDHWSATCAVHGIGWHEYTVEAWGDPWGTWRHDFHKKVAAGVSGLASDQLEGALLVELAAARVGAGTPAGPAPARGGRTKRRPPSHPDADRLREIALQLRAASPGEADRIATWTELEGLMRAWADRSHATEFRPYARVWVDRERAQFAAWYEFFPRSAEGKPDSGSTFRDCLGRIDDAKAMGFDVIYFPPIHPIGLTHRKGRNNATRCEPNDPGVPYAIGNRFQKCPNGGGHRDVAPELGTLRDFDWLVKQVRDRGMEIALDFAINCSPDHPYVHEHPDWFYKRPDGSIKYAENPPKKYEDVYPLNFHCADWRNLWAELTDVVLFWARHGVRIFRVDNPHTKPVAFWQHLIATVCAEFPDTIFLSEAFTRPKMMKMLAKAGFQQSYTYFTWRNTKQELTEYFTELTRSGMQEYFRGNLFPNTPDILPHFLQSGGRPAFLIRSALAATLSPVFGIYSGFELCENAAVPGREEYLDSEKYHFKGRDWNAPGNIKEWITALNRVRRENRALHDYANLRFHDADNDFILAYSKTTPARDNLLLIVVNVDPFRKHGCFVHAPIADWGIVDAETYQVHDLLTGERYLWKGERNYVELAPDRPAHVFRIRRWVSREQDFDHFL